MIRLQSVGGGLIAIAMLPGILSADGAAWAAELTADWYVRFMEEWEKGLNAYLATI